MSKNRYTLYEPTKKSIERMKEVQFYFFLQAFLFKYNADNQYIVGLIEDLALLFDCKPHIINTIITHFKSPAYRPDKQEIAVVGFLLGIPIRETTKIHRMGNDTYYKLIKQYINQNQPDLQARLSTEYRRELYKFLTNAEIMFGNVSYALKGMNAYDEFEL